MPKALWPRGFTLMEVLLVVAISGILIVGLAAIVEIPRDVAERQQTEAPISSADRLLALLDDEVRFAKDVRVPAPERLEIEPMAGGLVVYEWDGTPGGGVQRTGAGGTVEVLHSVLTLGFELGLSTLVSMGEEAPATNVTKTVESFSSFTLKPGYRMQGGLAIPGFTEVTVQTIAEHICANHTKGIVFRANGLAGEAAAALLRLRLRRDDTGNLVVRIYEASGPLTPFGVPQPDRTRLMAQATLANGAIPAAMADVQVPLSSVIKLDKNAWYFLEMTSDHPTRHAAEFEYLTLSNAAGAANFFTAAARLAGASYAPISAIPFGAQAIFSLEAVESTVPAGGGAATTTVQIPTSVHMSVALDDSGTPTSTLTVTIPIANNVAILQQQ